MAIRSRKSVARPAGHPKQPRPVERDHAVDIQRRAENLTKAIDYKKESFGAEHIAERQRQQVEHQMAQLRSEVVQARRLAQHIDNLSQDAAAHKRKPAMTDSSLVDPDNRHPVDFASRMQLLKDVQSISSSERSTVVQDLLRSWQLYCHPLVYFHFQ